MRTLDFSGQMSLWPHETLDFGCKPRLHTPILTQFHTMYIFCHRNVLQKYFSGHYLMP